MDRLPDITRSLPTLRVHVDASDSVRAARARFPDPRAESVGATRDVEDARDEEQISTRATERQDRDDRAVEDRREASEARDQRETRSERAQRNQRERQEQRVRQSDRAAETETSSRTGDSDAVADSSVAEGTQETAATVEAGLEALRTARPTTSTTSDAKVDTARNETPKGEGSPTAATTKATVNSLEADDTNTGVAPAPTDLAQHAPTASANVAESAAPSVAANTNKHSEARAEASEAWLESPPATDTAPSTATADADASEVRTPTKGDATEVTRSNSSGEPAATKPTATDASRAHVGPAPVTTPTETQRASATEAPRPPEPPAPLYDVERAADILRQVRVHVSPRIEEAHIQLHPAELGRMSIHVSFEKGRMKTTVRAEKPEALAAIEAHLPELRASLREQGILAQDFQLSLGLDSQSRSDDGERSSATNSANARATESNQPDSPQLVRAMAKTVGAGALDLYA